MKERLQIADSNGGDVNTVNGTYYSRIDGLRFIAVSFVLFAHFSPYYVFPFIYLIGSSAGWTGVDLFLVISGFLITTILLNAEGKTSWASYKVFIIRRTLRIFPIYYLLTGILLLLNVETVKKYSIYILTYTFNLAINHYKEDTTPVTHFWSLSLEEQFYLFWPLIVLFLKNKRLVLLTIIYTIIVLSFVQQTFVVIPEHSKYNFLNVFTRMGALALGALAALLLKTGKIPQRFLNNKYIEILVFGVLLSSFLFKSERLFFIKSLCSFYIVLKSVSLNFSTKWINTLLTNKVVIEIGKLSYGIYLFHLPVSYFLEKPFYSVWDNINFNSLGVFKVIKFNPYVITMPLYSFVTVVSAYFTYRFIERPILKLKEKYRY